VEQRARTGLRWRPALRGPDDAVVLGRPGSSCRHRRPRCLDRPRRDPVRPSRVRGLDAVAVPDGRRGEAVLPARSGGALAEWLLDRMGLSNDVAQNRSWPVDRDTRPELPYSGDRQVVAYQRGEQSSLRRALFGRRLVDTCALCGRALPVAMLVAAHIKRRADTSSVERRRTDNVMPACVLGCDDLFELGYITVSRAGIIQAGPRRRPMTSELATVVGGLLGRTCSFWDESRERYFAHHRRFQRREAERYELS